MNVTKPEKVKFSKRDKIIYISAIVLCALSLGAIIYIETTQGIGIIDMIDSAMAEEKTLGTKSEEECEILKSEFDNKFTNTIEKNSVSSNIKKLDDTKDLIYTQVEGKETKQNSYTLDIAIPTINIDSDIVKKYNEDIVNTFQTKLSDILKSENKNEVYTVCYVASINNEILSLMIKANLKEGTNAQRTIIQTYNYDIIQNKTLTLQDVLDKNGLDQNKIQETIKSNIEESQKKVDDLQALGYNIYSRDYNSGNYSISNSKEFYCTANTLYVVYAYGNDTYTSEMDVVVF